MFPIRLERRAFLKTSALAGLSLAGPRAWSQEASWKPILDLCGGWFWGVAAMPGNPDLLAAATYHGAPWVSFDRGNSWSEVSGVPQAGYATSTTYNGESWLFVGGWGTIDGVNWKQVTASSPNNNVMGSVGTTLFSSVGGSKGTIYFSLEHAALADKTQWGSATLPAGILSFALDPVNNRMLVGAGPSDYQSLGTSYIYSFDAQGNLNKLWQGDPRPWSLSVDPQGSVLLTTWGNAGDGLWRLNPTPEGKLDLETRLLDAALHAEVGPDGKYYACSGVPPGVAGRYCIRVSDDRGATWSTPIVSPRVWDFCFLPTGDVVTADQTYGLGKVNGTSFEPLNNGIRKIEVNSLIQDTANTGRVFVATNVGAHYSTDGGITFSNLTPFEACLAATMTPDGKAVIWTQTEEVGMVVSPDNSVQIIDGQTFVSGLAADSSGGLYVASKGDEGDPGVFRVELSTYQQNRVKNRFYSKPTNDVAVSESINGYRTISIAISGGLIVFHNIDNPTNDEILILDRNILGVTNCTRVIPVPKKGNEYVAISGSKLVRITLYDNAGVPALANVVSYSPNAGTINAIDIDYSNPLNIALAASKGVAVSVDGSETFSLDSDFSTSVHGTAKAVLILADTEAGQPVVSIESVLQRLMVGTSKGLFTRASSPAGVWGWGEY